MKPLVVGALLCLGSPALAQPPEPDLPDYQTPGAPTPGEPVPAPTRAAPPAAMPEPIQLGEDEAYGAPPSRQGQPFPGQESGRTDPPEGDSGARKFARGVLFLPRILISTLLAPVRLGVAASTKYEIGPRLHRWFYNDANTFGVYPSIAFESGFGFRLGAQGIYRPTAVDRVHAFAGLNVTGDRSRFALAYEALDRGDGRIDLGLGAEYDDRPDDKFYGYGNTNAIDAVPAMPVFLGVSPQAFNSEYASRLARATGVADTLLVSHLHTRVTAAIADRDRRDAKGDNDPPIQTIYAPASLVGFRSYRYGYAEGEVYWDDRARKAPWDHPSVTSTGSFASVWGGRMVMGDNLEDFWRYGVELQHFLRLGEGPRVLSARFHGEAITAELTEVPFTEVPALGGPFYLRGYPIDRFRDRIAAVGTLEYQWDLSYELYASLFVDCGRVYSSYDDLSLRDLRTGFGIAFEAHTKGYTGVRASIATSEDGDVFVNLYFEPIFTVKPRVERR
ncbi:MAG: hypothetical protein HOV81_06165 [Kofleriaceae bacterium]|nr:hypothetical protein [Kofleriaceae bacterium]